MSSLADLRRERGKTQTELSKSTCTHLYRIQAAEYGLGHGGAQIRTPQDFPDASFFKILAYVLRFSIGHVENAYRESCRLGDRQTFTAEELPARTFGDLIPDEDPNLEGIAQRADIEIAKLHHYVDGRMWCPRSSLKRLGAVLRVHQLRIDVALWGAHYRKTQHLLIRMPSDLHEPVRPRRA
jgi:hypothetical protein